MYFPTFDPYDEYTHDFIIDKMCIICWENDSLETLIQFKDIKHFQSNCECNVICHLSCLEKWIQFHKSCPICRKSIIDSTNDDDDLPSTIMEKWVFIVKIIRVVIFLLEILVIVTFVHLFYYSLLQLL